MTFKNKEGNPIELISYIKNTLNIKKVTIGITLQEDDNFTLLIGTPDEDWTKPVFVSGKLENADSLIDNVLAELPIVKVVEVPTTNASKVEAKEIKSAKAVVKKEDKPKQPVIDWSNVNKYMENKDYLKARYYVNELKTKHAKDSTALSLLTAKLEEIDKLLNPSIFDEPRTEDLKSITTSEENNLIEEQ